MKSENVLGKPHELEDVRIPVESEAQWQKHVMAALWICVAVLVVIGSVLVYAETHGLFNSSPHNTMPMPAWPAEP